MRHRATSRLAVSGARWLAAGSVLQRVFQALVAVGLARLLTPRDFGLVAIASLIVNLLGSVRSLGMVSAVIRRQEDTGEAMETYSVLCVLLAVSFYGVTFAAAPLIASYFGSPGAAAILRFMALALLTDAAAARQQAAAAKDLRFRTLALVGLGESLANGTISLSLAALGLGPWSLAGGIVGASLVSAVLWWAIDPWRPRLRLDLRMAGELLRFGLPLSAAGMLASAQESVERLAVGRWQGVAPLGHYDFSQRIIQTPSRQVMHIGQRVALPAFCKAQDDLRQLRQWYLKMSSYTCALLAPPVAVLLLLADRLVPLFFGPRWTGAILPLQILAPLLLLRPLSNAYPVFVATGHPRLPLLLAAVQFLLTAPALLIAARAGLAGVCLVVLASSLLATVVTIHLAGRLICMPWSSLAAALAFPASGTAVFAAALAILRPAAERAFGGSSFLSLSAMLLPAALAAYLFARARFPEQVAEMKKMLAISPVTGETGDAAPGGEKPSPPSPATGP